MVKGLNIFKEHFRDFVDQYVLIGGSACLLTLNEVGLDFRATKDLDVVLCVEALDAKFAGAFWSFVQAGAYEEQEKSTGEKQFYRFKKPQNDQYPAEVELFSRVPDVLSISEESHLIPIPVDDAAASLSAILLDEIYYDWIHKGKQVMEDISVIRPEYVIPLKAKAWLDLRERYSNGEQIYRKDFRKHKNDVFRLFQVLSPQSVEFVPAAVKKDMDDFLGAMELQQIELKNIGIGSLSKADIIRNMRSIYGID